jgi:hypothetical protein
MGEAMLFPMDEMICSATISPCGRYRYDLIRHWDGANARVVNFVMLNPSKADAEVADPTMTRCVRFAQDWGYGGIVLTNLYAFRATDPKDLWRCPAADRQGPENGIHLWRHAGRSALVVFAWGAHGERDGRGLEVRDMFARTSVRPHSLRLTSRGQPQHPLFLPRDTRPMPWPP